MYIYILGQRFSFEGGEQMSFKIELASQIISQSKYVHQPLKLNLSFKINQSFLFPINFQTSTKNTKKNYL